MFCTRFSGAYHYVRQFIISLFKKRNIPKVFCIGDVKTGTNSLYKALRILGYRTVRNLDPWAWYEEGWELYIKKLEKYKYDAYVDFPLGEGDLYQKIDKAIPNSKFILTLRDKYSFEKSYVNYFRHSPFETKSPQELEQRIQKFEQRNKQVIEYFKDRPSQLLVMNIFEGDGWNKLCNFLNKSIPNKPFPHKNIGRYKK
jgi:hypothetical protein